MLQRRYNPTKHSVGARQHPNIPSQPNDYEPAKALYNWLCTPANKCQTFSTGAEYSTEGLSLSILFPTSDKAIVIQPALANCINNWLINALALLWTFSPNKIIGEWSSKGFKSAISLPRIGMSGIVDITPLCSNPYIEYSVQGSLRLHK